MGPKRKSRASTSAVPKTPTPAPGREDDATEVDTPQEGDTPQTANTPNSTSRPNAAARTATLVASLRTDRWTDDQMSSLYKAIIRYKPTGMHKHFRMIAISEHLRNHGHKVEENPHTQVSHIWAKLREYYNMDVIDERDNNFDAGDDNLAALWTTYKPFDLRGIEWEVEKLGRKIDKTKNSAPDLNKWHQEFCINYTRPDLTLRVPECTAEGGDENDDADGNESVPSNDNDHEGDQLATSRKRKRGASTTEGSSAAGSVSKAARSSTVEDTEEEPRSSPVASSVRGSRNNKKRAVAKARAEPEEGKAEAEAEANDDSDEEVAGAEDDEDSEPENDAPTPASAATKATRSNKGKGRAARGRPAGTRKSTRK